MITAVDTNVLLDILTNSPSFAERSLGALLQADAAGALIIGDIVYAELGAAFVGSGDKLHGFLDEAGIGLIPSGADALLESGRRFRHYRNAGGPRSRILPDFLIGAHALHHANRLLTRDRGFYRSYFADLAVLEP
jgi:predicted nucleic acid-binding protein